MTVDSFWEGHPVNLGLREDKIILLDVKMPVLTKLSTCKIQFMASRCSVSVIFLWTFIDGCALQSSDVSSSLSEFCWSNIAPMWLSVYSVVCCCWQVYDVYDVVETTQKSSETIRDKFLKIVNWLMF